MPNALQIESLTHQLMELRRMREEDLLAQHVRLQEREEKLEKELLQASAFEPFVPAYPDNDGRILLGSKQSRSLNNLQRFENFDLTVRQQLLEDTRATSPELLANAAASEP